MVSTDERVLPIADHISMLPDLPLEPADDEGTEPAQATGTTGEAVMPVDHEVPPPDGTRAAHAQRREGSACHSEAQTGHVSGGQDDAPSERKEKASQRLTPAGPVGVTGHQLNFFSYKYASGAWKPSIYFRCERSNQHNHQPICIRQRQATPHCRTERVDRTYGEACHSSYHGLTPNCSPTGEGREHVRSRLIEYPSWGVSPSFVSALS